MSEDQGTGEMAPLKWETRGHVAILTLNRPKAMNSLTAEMLGALDDVFEAFEGDPDLWVAILTASGSKAFCAGWT